jgi:hypothetical protein
MNVRLKTGGYAQEKNNRKIRTSGLDTDTNPYSLRSLLIEL